MGRYHCSYCNNTVTRFGARSREAKHHFCTEECRVAYLKEHPPNQEGPYSICSPQLKKIKELARKKKVLDESRKARISIVNCCYCGKPTETKRKQKNVRCPECRILFTNLKSFNQSRRKRELDPYTIYQYCNWLIRKGKHVEKAKEILLYHNKKIEW